MKKSIIFSASFIAFPTIGLIGSTAYLYPDLRSNPRQMLLAFQRVSRVVTCGLKMAYIYTFKNQLSIDEQHYQAASSLKSAFLKNAGLYAKFGQVIASLDVLVPDPYKETFSSMFMECPSDPYEVVVKEIEGSTASTIQQLFREFDQVPISSASIAQVHRAVLHDGREVAVKVQHPWLRQQCEGDMRVIELFIGVGERLFPGFKYRWFAEEIRANLPKELNFKMEVQNQLRATAQLANLENIKIPAVIETLSNDKMITMEYIHGTSLIHLDRIAKEGYDLRKIAKTISEAFTQQLYRDGFIHSDPHQGNIFINGDKRNPTVVLLDHGLYTDVDKETRINYANLWKALIEQNEENIRIYAGKLNAGRDYRLFSAMVAQRSFEEIMSSESKPVKDRLGKPTQEDELDRIKQQAARRHKEITVLLGEINRTLLMLFKINDFLRTIDCKLGSPINTFEITYREVSDIIYQDKIANAGYIARIIFSFRSLLTKLKLRILGLILLWS